MDGRMDPISCNVLYIGLIYLMLLKIIDSVHMMELPTAVVNIPIDLNMKLINGPYKQLYHKVNKYFGVHSFRDIMK
jgi:hypothetical protein